MASKNNDEIVSRASAHTIRKFELIEKYVETWSQKLLNTSFCEKLVFIDCMCNSGEYVNDNNEKVFGTAVRVAKALRDAAWEYPNKKIVIYFNDINANKINHLKGLIGNDTINYKVLLSSIDGNDLLKGLGKIINKEKNTHYLLVYDPYDAHIDWDAIYPFLNNWGEVIINHMVYDSSRAVKMAKKKDAVSKYENTYLTELSNLLPYGSDKEAYEKRIEEIIATLREGKRRYFISAFPFFNSKNAIVYNLIHCTSNIEGFRLYKTTSWKVFGNKSSTKNTYGSENQLTIDLDNGGITTKIDKFCYYIKDIAQYIQDSFKGQQNVPLDKVWALMDEHPIFPYNGYRRETIKELKGFGAIVGKKTISFSKE